MNFAGCILNFVLRLWPLLAHLHQSSIMLKSQIYKIANNLPFDFFGKKVVQDALSFLHFRTWSMCFEFTWSVTQILHNSCDRELARWNSRKWLFNLLRIKASEICSNSHHQRHHCRITIFICSLIILVMNYSLCSILWYSEFGNQALIIFTFPVFFILSWCRWCSSGNKFRIVTVSFDIFSVWNIFTQSKSL